MNNLRFNDMCFNIKRNRSFYYNILYVKAVRTLFSLIIHDKSTSCISNREVMMLKITQKGDKWNSREYTLTSWENIEWIKDCKKGNI